MRQVNEIRNGDGGVQPVYARVDRCDRAGKRADEERLGVEDAQGLSVGDV